MRTRGQNIKDHWEENKDKQNYINLDDFIDYHYKQYLKLCFVCKEEPLSKSKWLTERRS